MYIFNKSNKLKLPVTIYTFKGIAEELTLINSKAIENFVDQKLVEGLKLGSKRLSLHKVPECGWNI